MDYFLTKAKNASQQNDGEGGMHGESSGCFKFDVVHATYLRYLRSSTYIPSYGRYLVPT